MTFDCTALAFLRRTPSTNTMRSFFAQQDHLGVLNYVIDCLDFMKIWHYCHDLAQVISLVGWLKLVKSFFFFLVHWKEAWSVQTPAYCLRTLNICNNSLLQCEAYTQLSRLTSTDPILSGYTSYQRHLFFNIRKCENGSWRGSGLGAYGPIQQLC